VEVRRVGSTVVGGDTDRYTVNVLFVFCVLVGYGKRLDSLKKPHTAYFDVDIPIPIVVKSVRVEDLKLGHIATAARALPHKLLIRVGALGVLVEVLHVRVRRRAVEVIVYFLDVFAMVS
jgi:hypothetical protein